MKPQATQTPAVLVWSLEAPSSTESTMAQGTSVGKLQDLAARAITLLVTSNATADVLAAPHTTTEFGGGERRLGRTRGRTQLARGDVYLRHCGADSIAGCPARTMARKLSWRSIVRSIETTAQRGPVKAAEHARRQHRVLPIWHRGRRAVESKVLNICQELMRVALAAVATRRPTTSPWRTRRAQLVGRIPCLGREALATSAAEEAAGARQKKTLKFTSSCMRGEFSLLLVGAAAQLG